MRRNFVRWMSVLMNKLNDVSLMKKLTGAYVIAILLPVLSIGGFTFYLSQRHFMEGIQQSTRQTMLQIKDNIHLKSVIAQSAVHSLAYNSDVQYFLNSEFSMNFTSIDSMNKIESLYSLVAGMKNIDIRNISIFTTNYGIKERWGVVYHDTYIRDMQWYKDFMQSEDDMVWLYPCPRFSLPEFAHTQDSMFTLVKKIYTPNRKYLGVVVLDIQEDNMLSSTIHTVSDEGTVYVIDKNKSLLYPRNRLEEKNENEVLNRYLQGESGSFVYKDTLYHYQNLDLLPITIVGKIPMGRAVKEQQVTSLVFLLVILIGMVVLVAFTHFLLKVITSKFRKIVQTMNSVAKGNFDMKIPFAGKDEVGQLAGDLNVLIEKINQLVRDIVRKESAQKDAQILALQYQINPHFIYNMIDTFRMKMELDGCYETADAIAVFGEMFRYNIGHGSLFTTLGEEAAYIVKYIELHRLKYGQRLTCEVHLPEELGQFEIIRFILQPIVENSIKHGFGDKQHTLCIRVTVGMEKGMLCITVMDNGVGMEYKVMDALNYQLKYSEYLEKSGERYEGIGLFNINERVKLFYGDANFIQLDSRPGEFTKTIVKIPYHRQ